jgi:hypothetical protein
MPSNAEKQKRLKRIDNEKVNLLLRKFRKDQYRPSYNLRFINHERMFGFMWWTPTGKLELWDYNRGKVCIQVSTSPNSNTSIWTVYLGFNTIDDSGLVFSLYEGFEEENAKQLVMKITHFFRGKEKCSKPLPSVSNIDSFIKSITPTYHFSWG